jgi:uncharacterized protein YbjT (DUF2867 family)
MKIVVIGGSGLIGSKLVSGLAGQGHQAVAAASVGHHVAEMADHISFPAAVDIAVRPALPGRSVPGPRPALPFLFTER